MNQGKYLTNRGGTFLLGNDDKILYSYFSKDVNNNSRFETS